MFRYAIQSISWAESDWEVILRDVKAAGFSGVEVFQHPHAFGGPARAFELFNALGLSFVGITSGSFEERCDFVCEYSSLLEFLPSHPATPYVYVKAVTSK